MYRVLLQLSGLMIEKNANAIKCTLWTHHDPASWKAFKKHKISAFLYTWKLTIWWDTFTNVFSKPYKTSFSCFTTHIIDALLQTSMMTLWDSKKYVFFKAHNSVFICNNLLLCLLALKNLKYYSASEKSDKNPQGKIPPYLHLTHSS